MSKIARNLKLVKSQKDYVFRDELKGHEAEKFTDLAVAYRKQVNHKFVDIGWVEALKRMDIQTLMYLDDFTSTDAYMHFFNMNNRVQYNPSVEDFMSLVEQAYTDHVNAWRIFIDTLKELENEDG